MLSTKERLGPRGDAQEGTKVTERTLSKGLAQCSWLTIQTRCGERSGDAWPKEYSWFSLLFNGYRFCEFKNKTMCVHGSRALGKPCL